MTTFSLYMSFWFMEILISNKTRAWRNLWALFLSFNFESSYTKEKKTQV